MGWLIANNETTSRRAATRHPLKDPAAAHVRAWLEGLYPDYQIIQPLEFGSRRMEVVTVYTSRNQNGKTRTGSMVYLWGVVPPHPAKER